MLICRCAEETGELKREVPFGKGFPEYPCPVPTHPRLAGAGESREARCHPQRLGAGIPSYLRRDPPTPKEATGGQAGCTQVHGGCASFDKAVLPTTFSYTRLNLPDARRMEEGARLGRSKGAEIGLIGKQAEYRKRTWCPTGDLTRKSRRPSRLKAAFHCRIRPCLFPHLYRRTKKQRIVPVASSPRIRRGPRCGACCRSVRC